MEKEKNSDTGYLGKDKSILAIDQVVTDDIETDINEEKSEEEIIRYNKEDKEVLDENIFDDIENNDGEPFDEEETEEDQEIKKLSSQIDNLENSRRDDIFPRSETKHDFASGILNNRETKKICNLKEYEIGDLVEKRKFVNFLSYFGWNGLSDRLLMNVHDVEDYSLSKDGRLLDSVFIEKSKSQNTQIETDKKRGAGR